MTTINVHVLATTLANTGTLKRLKLSSPQNSTRSSYTSLSVSPTEFFSLSKKHLGHYDPFQG